MSGTCSIRIILAGVLALASCVAPLSGLSSWAMAEAVQSVAGIEIVGNQRIDSAALLEQIKSSAGTVSSTQISADIKALYRTGFFSQVTAIVSADQILRFTVTEKPLVRKVFIEGNKEITEKDLADKLTVGATRYLDRAKIEGIMEVARAYYQSRGYYEAALTYSVAAAADNQVDVTFRVEEGKRFKIDAISFRGLKTVNEDALLEVIQTRPYAWWKSWLVGTGRLHRDMLDNDVEAEMNAAIEHAIGSQPPAVDTMFRDVYAVGEPEPRPLRNHLSMILGEQR